MAYLDEVKIRDAAGDTLNITAGGSADVNVTGGSVSLTGTVPLPTGASTSALQTSGNASLTAIEIDTTAIADTVNVDNTAIGAKGLLVGGFDGTNYQFLSTDSSGNLNVNATIGAGGATAANQVTEIAAINTLLKPADTLTKVTTVDTITNPVAVTGTFFQATQPVSAAALPLPTGASTSALQTAGNASLTSIDSKLTSPITVTGALTDTQLRASAVPVSLASSPLPTGAATSALQTTGNTSLSSIDTKTPALGQALNAASVPVVLTATQLTTLTPPAAITGFATETTLSALNTKVPANLTVTATRLLTDSSGVTQPVSAAALPLPTGASTSALQTTGNTALATLDTSVNTLLKPASTLAAVTTVGAVTAITNALPAGTNTIGNVNQTLATAGFGKVTDGTNTAAVKAASTAAVAADTALVVALSPNNNTLSNALFTKVTDGTNTEAVKAASTAPVAADPAGVVTLSPNVSTVATALAKAQNAAFAASDVGVAALRVRRDVNTAASTAGNYALQTVDQFGNTKVVGDIANGVADTPTTSFPVKTAAVAQTTALPTAVAAGQVATNYADKFGRIQIGAFTREKMSRQTTTMPNSTAETTIISAGGAGIFNDLYVLSVSNPGTNHNLTIRDTTAGTARLVIWVGTPNPFIFPTPLPQTTANANWTAQYDVAPGTAASVVTCYYISTT